MAWITSEPGAYFRNAYRAVKIFIVTKKLWRVCHCCYCCLGMGRKQKDIVPTARVYYKYHELIIVSFAGI